MRLRRVRVLSTHPAQAGNGVGVVINLAVSIMYPAQGPLYDLLSKHQRYYHRNSEQIPDIGNI